MNFFEKSQFVSAVELAARNGITTALRLLKPATTGSNPAPTPKFAFRQLASASPTEPLKPVTAARAATTPAKPPTPAVRAARPPKPPANRFNHLIGLGPAAARSMTVAASQAAPHRPAPTSAEFSAAAVTLAMTGGPLASWVEKPTDAELKAARAVVERQEAAHATSAVRTKAAAAAVAAKILAAGDYRGARRPT